MVVIGLPTTEETCVREERVAWPLTWTVQAPHKPMPQPYLVPCRLSVSRNTHRRGVSGSTSTVLTTLLIFNSMGIALLPRCKGDLLRFYAFEGSLKGWTFCKYARSRKPVS